MARILLIDDDDSFRKLMRINLTNLGHDVIFETHSVEGAMYRFQAEPPQVLITDLIMPGKEGLEIIGEFRLKHPGVKIIAMSGAGRIVKTNYLKMARARGADAVLAKPFSNDELEAALDQVLASEKPDASSQPKPI